MAVNTIELRQARAKDIADARAILDAAEAEKRAMSAEEEQRWQRLMDDAEEKRKSIEREEKQAALEAQLRDAEPPVAGGTEPPGGEPQHRDDPRATDEYRKAFGRWLRHGRDAVTESEFRALQADSDADGGYLVAPAQFVQGIIKAVDDALPLRGLATGHTTGVGQSLGAVSLDADPDDADWTSELATGTEDDNMAFGRRELNPHPLAKRIKVSNKLLRAPGMDAEAIVRGRLAYKFQVTLEKAYMTGDGAGKPLGIFTASSQGISTNRDVSTDNDATAITADGLISAKYALKSQYWARARWLFHRDALEQIHKLKDSNNQYLIQPNLQNGPAERLLGVPIIASEFAPNTFTASKYVGAIADFSYYWYVDALQFTLQRLVELYAEHNQTGFIGRYEGDGMPVLEEAFVRVKLASS